MKAVIYFSLSNRTKQIVSDIDADMYPIIPKGRVPKTLVGQMIVFGFLSVLKKSRPIERLDIDLSKYEEIVVATPVWAGRVSCFMRTFLEQNNIKNKKVTLLATCDGGPGSVIMDYKKYLGENEINEQVYIKGELV